jgi:TRAP-type mannitol/chloroaromatic compound transport system substrate-binding protein
MDDFKGLKYQIGDRVWGRTGDLIWEKILSDLGGSPTKGPFGRLGGREALLSGRLDAGEDNTPWRDMSFLGIHEVVKYCYFPGIQDMAGFLELIVNNQKWDALPPDLKEIVKGACDSAMARSLTRWAVDDAKVVKILNDEDKVGIRKIPREMQQEILNKFVAYYDQVNDPMFQKVWKSQKEFMKIYIPYMRLQQTDVEVKLK